MQAPFTPDITNGETYASNMREPTIIRAAVSRDLCEVAATELKNASCFCSMFVQDFSGSAIRLFTTRWAIAFNWSTDKSR